MSRAGFEALLGTDFLPSFLQLSHFGGGGGICDDSVSNETTHAAIKPADWSEMSQ